MEISREKVNRCAQLKEKSLAVPVVYQKILLLHRLWGNHATLTHSKSDFN
jgi:hypothetical protein